MLAQPFLQVKRFSQKKQKNVKATRLRRQKSHKNAANNAKTSFDNKL
jgi:hypothetical protein